MVTMRIRLNISMNKFKLVVHDKEGIPPCQQRVIFNGKQIEDDITLKKCGIQNQSMLHLILRSRAGMFHMTSGRYDFEHISCNVAEAIKQILAFKLKNVNRMNRFASLTLQESVLAAQNAPSAFFGSLEKDYPQYNISDLKKTCIKWDE